MDLIRCFSRYFIVSLISVPILYHVKCKVSSEKITGKIFLGNVMGVAWVIMCNTFRV